MHETILFEAPAPLVIPTNFDTPGVSQSSYQLYGDVTLTSNGYVLDASASYPYIVIPAANLPNIFNENSLVELYTNITEDITLRYPSDYRKPLSLYATSSSIGGRLLFGIHRSGSGTVLDSYLGNQNITNAIPLPPVPGILHFKMTRINGTNSFYYNNTLLLTNTYTNTSPTNLNYVLGSYYSSPGVIRTDSFSRPFSQTVLSLTIKRL